MTATIVAPSGRRFVGTNHCEAAQPSCPRAGMPTGVGYELCRDVCRQQGHAEVQALVNAALSGASVAGGVCYVEGHTYACADCRRALGDALVSIQFGAPPDIDSTNSKLFQTPAPCGSEHSGEPS